MCQPFWSPNIDIISCMHVIGSVIRMLGSRVNYHSNPYDKSHIVENLGSKTCLLDIVLKSQLRVTLSIPF